MIHKHLDVLKILHSAVKDKDEMQALSYAIKIVNLRKIELENSFRVGSVTVQLPDPVLEYGQKEYGELWKKLHHGK